MKRHKKRHSRKKFAGMSSAQLEIEANKILYGSATVPDRIDGQQYIAPKYKSTAGGCSGCGKPRADGSGKMCRACYLKRAAKGRRKSGEEAFDAEAYSQMEGVAFEAVGDEIFRVRTVQTPPQIDDVWRGQVRNAQRRHHQGWKLYSFEETEELLESACAA